MVNLIEFENIPFLGSLGHNVIIEYNNFLGFAHQFLIRIDEPIEFSLILTNSIILPDRMSPQNLSRPAVVLFP